MRTRRSNTRRPPDRKRKHHQRRRFFLFLLFYSYFYSPPTSGLGLFFTCLLILLLCYRFMKVVTVCFQKKKKKEKPGKEICRAGCRRNPSSATTLTTIPPASLRLNQLILSLSLRRIDETALPTSLPAKAHRYFSRVASNMTLNATTASFVQIILFKDRFLRSAMFGSCDGL